MTDRYDKLSVLRDQIDNAVILVSLENSFVSAHTIIMAAEELLRTWYVEKNTYVDFDYRFYIKDEHQRDYLRIMREKYNFFKHADRDIDAVLEIDREQLHKLNEMLLGILIYGYRKLISTVTTAMDIYASWYAIAYPDYIKWDEVAGGREIKAKIAKLDDDKSVRRQILRVMLYNADVLPKEDFEFLKIWNQISSRA